LGLPLVDQKTKALIAMTTDVVNQSISSSNNPFVYHVNMTLKLGASRDEVEEVLMFLAVYAGFNKVVGCFVVLNEIAPPAASTEFHSTQGVAP
jgi:4-carboxymuconolactone decarboxylase